MATRKSAKPTGKKRSTGATRSKSPAKKSRASKAGRRGTARSAKTLKTVRRAGKKTWEALKSTTAQVIEGVKSTFD